MLERSVTVSTKFKILWIEDSSDWLNISKLILEEIIEENYHIKLEVDISDGSNLDLNEIGNNNYDLIFTDYILAEDEIGTNIIKNIRNHNITSIILSYSSDRIKIFESINNGDFSSAEGIYFTTRDEFLENAKNLILDIYKETCT